MSKLMTKSIRLEKAESGLISQAAKDMFLSEAALLKSWILERLADYRIKKAVEVYKLKKADLASSASIAGISVREMMTILADKNVAFSANKKTFEESLKNLLIK